MQLSYMPEARLLIHIVAWHIPSWEKRALFFGHNVTVIPLMLSLAD